MQVVITATSSIIDEDTVLIEVDTKIGESSSSNRAGYSIFELTHSRYLAGTLEERIETLRVAAQDAAEASFKAQYAARLAFVQGQVAVPQAAPTGLLEGSDPEDYDRITLEAERHVNDIRRVPQEPVKKTRKPRTAKPTESQE